MSRRPPKNPSNIVFTAFSAEGLNRLKKAKARASEQLLKPSMEATAFSAAAAVTSPSIDKNLVGVGIGEKIKDGKHTGIMAVKFLVRIKYPDDQIPDNHRLPQMYDGMPVDVEQVGTFRRLSAPAPAMPNPRRKMRPAPPGSSVGFKDPAGAMVMAGTFGAVAKKGAAQFVLSNNHVLADENRLPLASPIFQPGLLDGGNASTDEIAKLTKFVKLHASGMNKVDCAIAQVLDNSLVTKSILGIGAPSGVASAAVDMVVHKFGRTTNYSVGRVTSISTDVKVGYEIGTLLFQDQIIVVGLSGHPFSASGDSGSLILERASQKAVGLLFAGSSSHTIANHIEDVLSSLGVTLA